jgi:NADH-quinone oxidoreductase subunit J
MPIGDTIPLTPVRWEDILFLALATLLIVSALLVVSLRDIIHCGLAMIVSFAALAGIYVLLGNPLLAATQVLVYIGAISILILFAIMLTQTKNAPTRLVFQTQARLAAPAAAAIALAITGVVLTTTWPAGSERLWTSTTQISTLLFNDYVLPFETVSVLLTAAVVGAVVLARRGAGESALAELPPSPAQGETPAGDEPGDEPGGEGGRS